MVEEEEVYPGKADQGVDVKEEDAVEEWNWGHFRSWLVGDY